jgi:predicted RNase H-like nuclease (RuvC/YqgF family)
MKSRWKMVVLAMAVAAVGARAGMSARSVAAQPAAVRPAVVQPAAMQPQEAQVTAQLLQEVRALRAALERMTVAGTRAQLLLARLQMQEQRMTLLGRQLQETRTKLADLRRERQSQAERIEGFTEGLDRLSPEQRLEMERGLKMTRQTVKQLDQQIETAQAEDLGVGHALSTEQSRWIDLNARLEELEGMLAAQKP